MKAELESHSVQKKKKKQKKKLCGKIVQQI